MDDFLLDVMANPAHGFNICSGAGNKPWKRGWWATTDLYAAVPVEEVIQIWNDTFAEETPVSNLCLVTSVMMADLVIDKMMEE